MLGGTMRAPLTGAVFAMELTGDISMLVPLFAASTAAYAVTVLLLKRSILTEKVARRGQHVTREYGVDPFELTRVQEVMAKPVDTLSAQLSVGQAIEALESGRHRIYPVVDAHGRPVGLVSRGDALRWRAEGGRESETLGDVVTDAALEVLHPLDLVSRAVDIMVRRDLGRLPVCDAKSGRIVGLVSRKDLLRVRASMTHAETERRAYYPTPSRA
jgi:CBS domain-containing protein